MSRARIDARKNPLQASLALVVLLLLLPGCSRRTRNEDGPSSAATPSAAAAEPPSATARGLSAWSSDLRKAHQLVDSAKSPEEQEHALSELARLFPATGIDATAKNVIPLRQDMASRAARLELALGEAEHALAWAERGLALSGEPTVLRANLLLDAADAYKMQKNTAAARTSLLEALRINQTLLDEELATP